ncbi:glycoside hydrolase family 52 protein [Streptomyces sp. NPDC056405]|uniref:glycoside hydrolase family 52 protein n=1 Tax=Streptomyces sp. NPDC056405 TaxID=3345811 RepID=UPI0035DA41E5
MSDHNIFFNTHHAPAGAFASFTLGCRGAMGGLGLELSGPAQESVWAGAENPDTGRLEAFPFFESAPDDRLRFDSSLERDSTPVVAFRDGAVRRELTVARDTWRAGDLTLTLWSPAGPLPDPDDPTCSSEEAARAYLPAVFAELELDNTAGDRPRRMFFGWQGSDPTRGMRHLTAHAPISAGVAQGRSVALATSDPRARSAIGFDIEDILYTRDGANRTFGLGTAGALVLDAPAGERTTLRVAVGFHRAGPVTTGIDTTYLYTRWFADVEEVLGFALADFGGLVERCAEHEKLYEAPHLSDDQRFMLAHAVRGYFASTQALDDGGRALWVVNEGEYRMMNTFDLTADHVFFEARMNPWTVRNVLDLYADRYAYRDRCRAPGQTATSPGGIAFTHDMGVANAFSPAATSSYERSDCQGVFSYMAHEQLANWVLCAAVYRHAAHDTDWLRQRLPVLRDCLHSLLQRDHPDPAERDGVMSLDSDRCGTGSEITTYDSLDNSLGQARRSAYLAVKSWAAYLCLGDMFDRSGLEDEAGVALDQARRCASTVTNAAQADGLIPALLDEGDPTAIVPVIEGLAHLWAAGLTRALDTDGPHANLIVALARHVDAVLKPERCLFPDGGWKLSATSPNSWLSKIYLCEFVAGHILQRLPAEGRAEADRAHRAWLVDPRNAYWGWSDQMHEGVARGSRYYPRGVTAILWLHEV